MWMKITWKVLYYVGTTSQFQKHSDVLGSLGVLKYRFPQPGNSFSTGGGVRSS